MGLLDFPWSPKKVGRIIEIHKIFEEKQGAFCSISKKRFPTFLTSGPLADKQKSLDTQLNFMVFTFSPIFVVYLLEGQMYQGFFTFLAILAYCVSHCYGSLT